jgi:hypothetical protein
LRKLKEWLFGLSFKEIKMNKKLIIGLALAVVLLSGSTFSARADLAIDKDCAGNLITPDAMASVSGGW